MHLEPLRRRLGVTEPPALLLEAIRLALGDVDPDQSVASLWLSEDRWVDPEDPERQGWWIEYRKRESAAGGGFGVGVRPGHACYVFVDVAEQFHDHLGDDLDSGSWHPYCGLHGHPATPVCLAGEARWSCPGGPDLWSVPIGTLGAPPEFEQDTSGTKLRIVIHWPRT